MESIVISGISGRFPESENVEEFWTNLLNKVDLVTEDDRRWKPGLWGLPKRNGKLKNLEKFDASFFEIHPKQANNMDSQLRMLLEVVYEAVTDAGVNPSSIAGSNTGVWVGNSSSEVREALTKDPDTTEGYVMTGCFSSMMANRISYFFDVKGTSVSMDTACSSSTLALQNAFVAIRDGYCDAAIVGGTNVIHKPHGSLMCQQFNMLSSDGSCKSFDSSANGYVRSEAVVAVYLQRKSMAVRSYCEILNARTNSNGKTTEGITYPSGIQQARLLEDTYSECGADPCAVDYVEAHGTGTRTKAGDPQELNAIDQVMCKEGRKQPLLVGSVKSNMGHSESASGLCGVVKCAVAMQMGVMPSNLHFKQPNPEIKGLLENRLRVVTENTKLPKTIMVGVNSFGFGGTNVHVILRSSEHDKPANEIKQPTIALLTGRTENGIKEKLEYFSNCPISRFSMTNKLAEVATSKHPYRGFIIKKGENDTEPIANFEKAKPRRDIWFICTGMGSQWNGMGRHLLQIPVFAKSIDACTDALKDYNFNVKELIIGSNSTTYDNLVNSVVGLVAVQIGLIDLLRSIGIRQSGVIGHSVGELACSYADGCLTLEQTIQIAYLRGVCIIEAKLPVGAMAAVGLTWEDCEKLCEGGEVAPACHNSNNSVTLTGPKDAITTIVEKLQKEKVFARMVNTSDIAFHSKDMQLVYPRFLNEIRKIIKEPKKRSKNWISTSIKKFTASYSHEENDIETLSCSAEYHANNLRNVVRFHEGVQKMPSDVIVIEIAPHALMQPVLKKSLPLNCDRVVLADRKEENGIQTLLKGLGKLHCLCVDINLEGILPRRPLPTPKELLQFPNDWDHAESWYVPGPEVFTQHKAGITNFILDFSSDSENSYLSGHVIDGRAILPAALYIQLAWKSFAKYHQVDMAGFPVQFNKVKIQRATTLPVSGKIEFVVNLIPTDNSFQVSENGNIVCLGKLQKFEGSIETFQKVQENCEKILTQKEIYRKMRLSGYQYKGKFQAIRSATQNGQYAEIPFDGNYVTFLDGMFQLELVETPRQELKLPISIGGIKIVPQTLESGSDEIVIPVMKRNFKKVVSSGCCEVSEIETVVATRRGQTEQPLLKKYTFVPNIETEVAEQDDVVQLYAKVLEEYINKFFTSSPSPSKTTNNNGLGKNFDFYDFERSVANVHLLRMNNVLLRNKSKEEMVKEHISDLVFDPLLNYCVSNTNCMATTLDVFLENADNYVRVAEIPNTYFVHHLREIITQHLDSDTTIEYDYSPLGFQEGELSSWDSWSHFKPPPSLMNLDLIVTHRLFQQGEKAAKQVLQNAIACVSANKGFILLHEITQQTLAQNMWKKGSVIELVQNIIFEQIKKSLKDLNLEIIVHKSDEKLGSHLLLCRSQIALRDNRIGITVDHSNGFSWVEELQESVANDAEEIWLIGKKTNSGLAGLMKCLRKEPGSKQIRCLIYDGDNLPISMDEIIKRNLTFNVFESGQLGTFRHTNIERQTQVKVNRAWVKQTVQADISTLKWITMQETSSEPLECAVAYASLSNKDVVMASGKLQEDTLADNPEWFDMFFGTGFSGFNEKNEKVMGIVQTGGLATHVQIETTYLWKVPDQWSLCDAATVPYAYCIAFYAIVEKGRIRKGERVLITDGESAFAEAAIGIAVGAECDITVTVSSEETKAYLKERFMGVPNLKINDSKTASLDYLMTKTNGRGMDLVLTNTTSTIRQNAFRSISKYGRIIEIENYETSSDVKSGSMHFRATASYCSVTPECLFDDAMLDREQLTNFLRDGINTGIVKPIRRTIFSKYQIQDALRQLTKEQDGRVTLIKVKDTDSEELYRGSIYNTNSTFRTTFDSKLTYVITGGLGGFGLELCNWMVERGARHVLLTTRSGANTAYQQLYIRKWKSEDVKVIISTADVSTADGAKEILTHNVGGIFHLAMVLKDALFMNQSPESFSEVCRVKCDGVQNLDRYSRELCPNLEHFVVFSSVSSARGNVGQTNYGYANSFMERICEMRERDGFPALAIQWGAIGDVGIAAEIIGDQKVGGSLPQSMQSSLKTLDVFLSQCKHVTVLSIVVAPKDTSLLVKKDSKITMPQAVANLMGIKDYKMEKQNVHIANMGMDSLMAVEISQMLERNYGFKLTGNDVQQMTFEKLEKLSANGGNKNYVRNDTEQDLFVTVHPEALIKLNDSNDVKTMPWFFVHPIGGSSLVFKDITKHLIGNGFGLNFTEKAPLTTIEELASHYLEVVGKQQSYNLVGYSFGACVAFEMAMQLSKKKETINLVLIDGSHSFIADSIQSFVDLMGDEDAKTVEELQEEIPNVKQYKAKLHNYTRLQFERASLTYENIRRETLDEEISRYSKRLEMAHFYKVKGKYPGDITLIRQKKSITHDYNLNEVCNGKVQVITQDATHENIIRAKGIYTVFSFTRKDMSEARNKFEEN
uniref:Fatty acid synthase n=1 Tax=Ciona intestinalis TaxID=7719 RepID=H2Y3E5_CIOIN